MAVRWVRWLTPFQTLSRSDQQLLLQESWKELFLLYLAQWSSPWDLGAILTQRLMNRQQQQHGGIRMMQADDLLLATEIKTIQVLYICIWYITTVYATHFVYNNNFLIDRRWKLIFLRYTFIVSWFRNWWAGTGNFLLTEVNVVASKPSPFSNQVKMYNNNKYIQCSIGHIKFITRQQQRRVLHQHKSKNNCVFFSF